MTLAFLIYKYFPFGGAQRDCLNIAKLSAQRGHRVTILCRTWEGDRPDSINVVELGEQGLSNIARNRAFIANAHQWLAQNPVDGVIGFSRMPGLDVYFCADSCWQAALLESGKIWRRWLPRYRHFLELEAAVFGREASTQILMLTPREIPLYQQFYGTGDRFHLLPPGIARTSFSMVERSQERHKLRGEFGWTDDTLLLLFVGSGFRTKGLDRAVRAIAALPASLRDRAEFAVIGQNAHRPFANLASRLGIGAKVHFLGGRKDVMRFYLAADLLIHPALKENTGTVLLEAIAAGLPVLTTEVCGYAPHVQKARAGVVLAEPFRQELLNETLAGMLQSPDRSTWRANGLAYAATEELYSQDQKAVEIIEQTISEKRSARSG